MQLLKEHEQNCGLIQSLIRDSKGIKAFFKTEEDCKNYFLSIGFKAEKYIRKNSTRILNKIKLVHIAIVKYPAQLNTEICDSYNLKGDFHE